MSGPGQDAATDRWWGEFPMREGSLHRWRIGPATLWIERRPHEWLIRTLNEGDPFSEELEIAAPADASEIDDARSPAQRFAGMAGQGDGHVVLLPRLADRNVVSRPEEPFSVVPGGSLKAYVGSPVWLAIAFAPGTEPIVEFPISRPSDTWFGLDTCTGDLCYASRTRLRLNPADVRRTPHRAVTEIHIKNAGTTPLRIDRITVPVPALSLYADAAGMLRTSSLSLARKDDDDEIAEVEIDSGTPQGGVRIAAPRVDPPQGFMRAFSQLL